MDAGWDTTNTSPLSDWTYLYNDQWQLIGGVVRYDNGSTYLI
jgi:hypothetical protein